jgi:hypothetical protein
MTVCVHVMTVCVHVMTVCVHVMTVCVHVFTQMACYLICTDVLQVHGLAHSHTLLIYISLHTI